MIISVVYSGMVYDKNIKFVVCIMFVKYTATQEWDKIL